MALGLKNQLWKQVIAMQFPKEENGVVVEGLCLCGSIY
jgi:hypothetical protein